MDIIVEIGRLISSTLEIEEVYERFAVEVRKLIPFDRININLKDPGGETFTLAYVAGVDIPGRRAGDRIPLRGSITEEVLRTRAGLFLHPVSEEEIRGRFPGASAVTTFRVGMQSIMAVPLISRDEAIGVLHFRAGRPNVYGRQDLILAERIGRQIAGAIANAGLFARLERLAEEMAIIAEIGRLIGSTLDIDDVYKRVAAEVRRLITVDWLSVNLIDPDKETLTITYTDGYDIPRRRPGDAFAFAGSITETVERKRAGLLFHPASDEEMMRLYPGSDAITFHAGMRSIMAVPLISQDELIGALHFRAKRPNAFTEQDLRLAERIGAQIAGAVANARLFKQLQKVEASLRESEARFRAIFEQAAVGVAELDIATGRFLTVNWRLCELVGRTEEELMASTFLEITHPDDRSLHLEGMALLTAGKVPNFTLEKRYLRKDGETVWVSITLSPLWREGEPLSRNIIVVQDITERRRIGEELDRHSKRLVALNETGVELTSELKLNALLYSIAERALALIGGNYCNCYLYRPEADRLERVAIAGEAIFAGTPIRQPGEGFVGHVWSTRAPFIVDDYLSWPGRMREFDFAPPRTLLGMPIRWGDQYRGVLVLMARLPHRYTQADADVLGMFSTQAAIAIRNAQLYDQMNREIAERRQAEEALKTTLDHLESRVRERTIELEETNTALRVLIKKGDEDQKSMEENLQSNVSQLVTPFLLKLRESQTDQERQTYLNILETNLNHIVSPFIHRLSTAYRSLTPKEIQIAELVKQGKMSREIAKLFGLSVGTVITHRNNIRKKLDLKSRDANLRSHLLSLV
jgi:PAS domain S-box-containing protein